MRIDLENGTVELTDASGTRVVDIASPEAFAAISQAWIRSGWDAKYVYSFSWLGRPIIQLPEDMIRIQEVLYEVQPDVVLETGIAHGGSLVFYASILRSIGKGRVIGVDIDVREHNREQIENHALAELITMFEGSSTDPEIVKAIQESISPAETVLVLLDSDHSKEHVHLELEMYGPLVTSGSFMVACDGIMQDLEGAPRSQADWRWNNPQQAAKDFVAHHPEFHLEEPTFPFNEGSISKRVTYWPNAFLRRS